MLNALVDSANHKNKRANFRVKAELLNINALGINSSERETTEQFIKNGYSKAYEAQISITTPYLISLNQGVLKSALGVRGGKESLFIEQYLDSSIEKVLASFGISTPRQTIAEIAHLYSNAKVFTIPLMLVTAVALMYKGFTSMVFTGTQHVIGLINKTGINVQVLETANPVKLTKSKNDWGSYYNSKPQVACIKLTDVLKIITLSEHLSDMFDQLSDQVAKIVLQLESL